MANPYPQHTATLQKVYLSCVTSMFTRSSEGWGCSSDDLTNPHGCTKRPLSLWLVSRVSLSYNLG